MSQLSIIECIPNISCYKSHSLVDKWKGSIANIPNLLLCRIDSDYDTNRTVFTLIGHDQSVFEAIEQLFDYCSQGIDMTTHHGTHPRIGAIDVCPFVPLLPKIQNDLQIKINHFAKYISSTYQLPIYYYEQSQTKEYRKYLEQIRKGNYEGFEKKMTDLKWKPDFGPHHFNYKMGATVMGIREYLIAYNIGINTQDLLIAKKIANLMTSKRKSGNPIYDGVKIFAWYARHYGHCQISTNITKVQKTGLYPIYQDITSLAHDHQIEVKGSEIIGLIPKIVLEKVLEDAEIPHSFGIERAVKLLGLDYLQRFDLDVRLVESWVDRLK